MKGLALRYGGIFLLVVSFAASAYAEGVTVTDADRSWDNYVRDAAVVGNKSLRLELRGMYMHDDDPNLEMNRFPIQDLERRKGAHITDIEGGILELLGSYGVGNQAELGFKVPVLFQSLDLDPFVDEIGTGSSNDADMGDVLLYGKFKRKVAENCHAALGLEITVPTGIEKKGFGTGDVGFNPFLSSRYQRGRFGLGAHVGYVISTGDTVDVLNYSFTAIARGSALWLLRVEVSGRMLKDFGETFNDLSVLPGLEFNVTDQLTLRPTFTAGIAKDAFQWGGGLGIVFTL